MEYLESIDRELFLFLNGLRLDWLDMPMLIISTPLFSLPWIFFALYLIFKKQNLKYMLFSILGLGLVILLNDRVSVELFKEVFLRYRPTHNLEIRDLVHTVIYWNGSEYRGGTYGFVSSHAANYFGLACFFWMVIRPNKNWIFIILFAWAILVAYSRIYLGVHYPADIIGGATLGLLLGLFSFAIFSFAARKFNLNETKNL